MLLQRGSWIYARHVTGFCYRRDPRFIHDTLLAVVKLKAHFYPLLWLQAGNVCVCLTHLSIVVVTGRKCLWMFGSVQFIVHLFTRESPYALHPVSRKFPQHCLWNGSNVRLNDDGPLLSFQGRLSSASSFRRLSSTSFFHASLLQAIDGVMSLTLCTQVVPQAPPVWHITHCCCYRRGVSVDVWHIYKLLHLGSVCGCQTHCLLLLWMGSVCVCGCLTHILLLLQMGSVWG